MIVFSDFQCPFCKRVEPSLTQIEKEYPNKIRVVWKNMPLDMHQNAKPAAAAALAAGEQGKFWEMHDKMFGNQQKLEVDALKGYAKELGLEAGKFDKCLDSGEKKGLVEQDQKAGEQAGVNGTPAFFVNGVFINGAVPYEQLKAAVDRELGKKG
jgi:protein-disulfide isomerase